VGGEQGKAVVPAGLRWSVLLFISLAMFGNYYIYDCIAPLASLLTQQLGFTDTQIGTLNAIYSVPNIFVVLIGGIIADRLGTRLATLLFTAICLVGAIMTWVSGSFVLMAVGRLVFGLGAESMIVAITAALGQWFKGKQLGFAFGINLAIARAGSFAADWSPTWAKGAFASGWKGPLLVAVGFGIVALVSAIVYFVLERRAESKYDLDRPKPSDRFLWSDLVRFDRSYWYVVGLCVTFYSVIFPFRSTFAIKYFQDAHGLSLEKAGQMNSWVFLAAIFATPLFGLLVDKLGRRSLFMTIGTLVMVPAFLLMAYTQVGLWLPNALIGIAFSLVPAVLWPSVAYLVEENRLGTAYGLMTLIQNIGLTVFNLAAGVLNDSAGASATNPNGYLPMLWMFLILSLAGLVFSWLLRRRETGPEAHGLETVRAHGL
jgi:MFS family permease